MELQEFISTTLKGIIAGVVQVKEEIEKDGKPEVDASVLINPPINEKGVVYAGINHYRAVQFIEFDLLVGVKEVSAKDKRQQGRAGVNIEVLSMFSAQIGSGKGVEKHAEQAHEQNHRIRFSVPVSFPSSFPAEPRISRFS